MSTTNTTQYGTDPALAGLNKVPGFDPRKFMRKTGTGESALDLRYKKLWFRLAHPDGRIRVSALKLTDQLAIVEARVFFSKDDAEPVSSHITQRGSCDCRLYVEAAQYAAVNQALDDAGFGIQLCESQQQPVVEVSVIPSITQPETVAEAPKPEAAETPPAAPIVVLEEAPEVLRPEEIIEVPQLKESTSTRPAYTADMPVDEICVLMSPEEAGAVVVDVGTCNGWTLAQVREKRPASLKWYLNGYPGNNNILRAGAKLLLEGNTIQKAG
jgi:hypothetical protein